ncbi:MAG: LPS export ABC transporter periplasmic protein LptC [Bacteroidales bacterium]|nr:LPS export ABC transporter periplasmic protein LptC [Bacteroidales bacterium]
MNINTLLKISVRSIMALLPAMVLFSCENPIATVRELSREDTLADVTARDMVYTRSDSGIIQMTLSAPKMNRYTLTDAAIEFPEGFEAFFYDSLHVVTSSIKANYGISYEKTKLLMAKNAVEVENFQTLEKLNSETLFWDQMKHIIYTRAPVKITSPDKVIYGDSLVASEGFDRRVIYNVRATIEVDEEEAP